MTTLPIKYLNWKAVAAGAVFAVGITFLFNLLTIALGLSLLPPNQSGQIALTFGAVAWAIIGSYMTLFVAGFVSGRMISNEYSMHWVNGVLHGFMTWSLYLMISWVLIAIMTDTASAAMLKSFLLQIDVQQANEVTKVTRESANAVNKMGYVALTTFFVFLVGALGSCLGGHCGVRECKVRYG